MRHAISAVPRTAALVLPLLACTMAVGPAAVARAAPERLDAAAKVFAFGDVHGAFDDLVSALRAAGIVDGDLRWAAGTATVVSVGDLLDRGPASRQVLDLLMRLEEEATAAGGRLAVIVGNHEVMNLMGDLRYVSPGEYAAFAADEPAELRARMLDEFRALPANAGIDPATVDASFNERYPPGWFAHRTAFAPQGIYGGWLLERPAVLVIGDTAFVHGGLPPLTAELGLEQVNERYRTELARYFDTVAALEEAGLLTVFDDANERASRIKTWLESPASTDSPQRAAAEALLAADQSQVLGLDSPLWYRGTALCHSALEWPTTHAGLERLGVRRVVFGHTPTPRGRIYQRFDGRAFRIDTGMNRAVYNGHPATVLIERGNLQAIYAEPGIDASIEALPSYAGGPRLGIAEQQLLDAMQSAAIDERQPEGPDALAVSVTVEGVKIPAVYRWLDKRATAHEIAAYRLDRLLDIGLVPPTVSRELDGRAGVLQLRPGRIESLATLQAAGKPVRASWCPVDAQYQLLYAFDTLILNERRTPDSILYDTDEWMVMASTHDDGFDTARRLPRQLANASLEALPGLLERLDELSLERLEAALGDLLSKREIKAILERARLLPRSNAAAAAAR